MGRLGRSAAHRCLIPEDTLGRHGPVRVPSRASPASCAAHRGAGADPHGRDPGPGPRPAAGSAAADRARRTGTRPDPGAVLSGHIGRNHRRPGRIAAALRKAARDYHSPWPPSASPDEPGHAKAPAFRPRRSAWFWSGPHPVGRRACPMTGLPLGRSRAGSSGSVPTPPGSSFRTRPSRRVPTTCRWARQIVESAFARQAIRSGHVRPGLHRGQHVDADPLLPAAGGYAYSGDGS